MITGFETPKLWCNFLDTDQAGNDQCDCDCACSGFSATSRSSFIDIHRQISDSIIQEVKLNKNIKFLKDKEFTVAVGDSIIVFDDQIKNLLQKIDNLVTISSIKKENDLSENIIEQSLALLLSSRVLQSPQLDDSKFLDIEDILLSVWLHITNECNLSCKYCYLPQDKIQMDESTAKIAVDVVFQTAQKHGYSRIKLKYSGGEPTLNFDTLITTQLYAEEQSKRTGIQLDSVMLTNGVNLDDNIIEALLKHNIKVMISLDGIGEYHNLQRPFLNEKLDSYKYVIENIQRYVDNGISPHISITVTKKNIKGLPELVSNLIDQKLKFSINFYREPSILPKYNEYSFRAEDLIMGLFEVYSIIENNLPDHGLLAKLSDRAYLHINHEYPCGAGRNYLVINSDGGIAKCQMDITDTVSSIYCEDPLEHVRSDTKSVQNLSVEDKDCRECQWRYYCAGGCPRLTFQATGRYDAKSPLCAVYKAILPKIVRLEALRLMKYEKPWDFSLSS